MLTEQEKKLTLTILEEDLREYITGEEWNEYIPKLLQYFNRMPSRDRRNPDSYINEYFTWYETEEGETYWREWHKKVFNRVYYGASSTLC